MRQCLMTEETPGELPVCLFRKAELWLSFGPLSEIHFPELVEQKKLPLLLFGPNAKCVDWALGLVF